MGSRFRGNDDRGWEADCRLSTKIRAVLAGNCYQFGFDIALQNGGDLIKSDGIS